MPAERHFRAFARRAVDLPAVVTPTSGSAHPARLVDLGLGGARVRTAQPMDVGAVVTLQVSAPNLWDPLVVRARVAWSTSLAPTQAVAGLAFTHEEEHALPSLVELLSLQTAD